MGAFGAASGDILQRYSVVVDADTDELQHGLREAGSESNRAFESMQKDVVVTETRMQSLARTMRTVVIPALVAGGAALTVMKVAAVSSDRSMRILRNSLVDIDQPGQNSARTIANLADKLSHFTTTSESKVMRLAAVGASLGQLTGRDLEQATAAAIGLAARYGHLGVSSEEAMRMIARAANGDATSLRKLGIQLDDSMSGQQKYNAILQIGARGLKVAGEEAKTTEGQLRRLSNASKELFAAGGRLLGLGEKGGGVLEIVIDGIEEATIKVDAFRGTLVGLRDDALALVGIDPANLFSFGSIKIEMEGLIDRGAVKIASVLVGIESQVIRIGETIEAKLVGAAEAFRDSMMGVGSDIKTWITDQADTIRRKFFGLPDPLPDVPKQRSSGQEPLPALKPTITNDGPGALELMRQMIERDHEVDASGLRHLTKKKRDVEVREIQSPTQASPVLPTTREGAILWMRQLAKKKRGIEVQSPPPPPVGVMGPIDLLTHLAGKVVRDLVLGEIQSPTTPDEKLKADRDVEVGEVVSPTLSAESPRARAADMVAKHRLDLPVTNDEAIEFMRQVIDRNRVKSGEIEHGLIRRDADGNPRQEANAGGVGPGLFSAAANIAMMAIATPLGESLQGFIDGYAQREKARHARLAQLRLENEQSKSTTDKDALSDFIDTMFGVASDRGVGLGNAVLKEESASIATAVGNLTIAAGVIGGGGGKDTKASPEQQLKQSKELTKHVLGIFQLMKRATSGPGRPLLR